jgi:predicted oxidoreductase
MLWIAWLLACTSRPDVVVIGGGPAGMAAAIEAADEASVVLVEGRGVLGGSLMLASGATALPTAAHWGEGPPSRQRYVARVRPDVIDWTTSLGAVWEPIPDPTGVGPTLMAPRGGGGALTGVLAAELERRGVTVRTGVRAVELVPGDDWTVVLGDASRLQADAVIIATGGFMANVARVRRDLDLDVAVIRGAPRWADGAGAGLATANGAAVDPPSVLLYGHGVPHPDDPTRALMVVEAKGAWAVGADGTPISGITSPRGNSGEALRRAGGTGWLIADGRSAPHLRLWDIQTQTFIGTEAAGGPPLGSLAALAAYTAIPVETLAAGLAVDAPTDLQPLRAQYGFVALPLRLTTAKALSGLRTDLDGRVLDAAGAPVVGLFAAGEVMGFGSPYAGAIPLDSTMVAGAVLTGRVAGRTASTIY